MLPKKRASNVEVIMMTLYGIEKSGVGRSTRTLAVWMRLGRAGSSGKRTAAQSSKPREASGGCSPYSRNCFRNGERMCVVLLAGRTRCESSVVGRVCGIDASYEMDGITSSRKMNDCQRASRGARGEIAAHLAQAR